MVGKAENGSTLKNRNRARILGEVRRRPLSRAQLAGVTGLSKSAVTALANGLIAEGLLVETGTTAAPLGRRPVMLSIAADAGYAVGVELHRRRLTVVLTDALSAVVERESHAPDSFSGGEEALGWICDAIRAVIRRRGVPEEKLLGIGVSSPGPLDYRAGVILNPPNFPLFQNTPIAKRIGERFRLPVLLDNNAVLLARTEYVSGPMQGYRNAMFVIVSDGIGACVIGDGQVYRGFGGYAGELGHTSIDRDGPSCSCGNRGCLELYATMAALKARFGFDRYEDVADAAALGDPGANRILDDAAGCLAVALTDAVNLLDLDAVFLYGEYGYRAELITRRLEDLLASRSMIRKAHPVAVRPSSLGPDASAISTTAAVLDRFFDQKLPPRASL